MKKIDWLILVFLILTGLALRLYKIDTPLADFHSWRQVDTASVAKNFVDHGFDLLHPKFHDLSNVPSGKDNPNGYRFVEFPLYNTLFAGLYKLFPQFSVEVWGRLVSIFFSLVTLAIIYFLIKKEVGRPAAVFAGLTYAVMPFFVFFSRVVLPESMAVGLAFLAIFVLYLKPESFWLSILSSFIIALGILVKPTVIFYGLAIGIIFIQKYRLQIFKKPAVYVFAFIALLPFMLWRNYIKQFPEGIPFSEWLITSVNTPQGLQSIFFKPAFFRWIFFERINNIILGGYMAAIMVIGIFVRPKKWLLTGIGLSALIYLFVFQGGNVQHEYYQTIILPALAVFCGLGAGYLTGNRREMIKPVFGGFFIFTILVFSWFFSYYRVKDYYGYPADLVQMAKVINSLTQPQDIVATDQTGDTTLLYLSQRTGSGSIFKAPADLKKIGFTYITSGNSGMIRQLTEEGFKSVFHNEQFAVFKL